MVKFDAASAYGMKVVLWYESWLMQLRMVKFNTSAAVQQLRLLHCAAAAATPVQLGLHWCGSYYLLHKPTFIP